MSEKPKAAFTRVHSFCRSQIAEALGKHFAADVFESYSAETETKPQIKQDAARLMKRPYGIDIGQTRHSKPPPEIPPVDIVVTMGCNVVCPYLLCKHREDWRLDDPTGKGDHEFIGFAGVCWRPQRAHLSGPHRSDFPLPVLRKVCAIPKMMELMSRP